MRREHKDIYYFSEKGECDFILFEKGKIKEVIQVCYRLNQDNLERELRGLYEAFEFFNLERATIITFEQKDRFEREGRVAKVIPAHTYMSEVDDI